MFAPFAPEAEVDWNPVGRTIFYGAFLFWSFLGVAIVADVFMSAIEKITSQKKRIVDKKTGRNMTVQVWNDTVANLSLMALGSSAPEILLSILEVVGENFFSGELGPSTIVGSAAFNLMVICAVCVCAIPSPEVRYIKEMPVYIITATSSVFAYVWLVIILQFTTPDKVTVIEGVLTLLFFPILLVLAYLADIGMFAFLGGKRESSEIPAAEQSEEELAAMVAKIRKEHGKDLSEEKVLQLAMKLTMPKKSAAQYKIEARQQMRGGHKHRKEMTTGVTKMLADETKDEATKSVEKVTFEFAASAYAVLENKSHVTVQVVRKGPLGMKATVNFATKDETAKSTEEAADYEAKSGTLEFGPDETQKDIEIKIVDDVKSEEDETFKVELSEPTCDGTVEAELGDVASTEVTIIDDDKPGVIAYEADHVEVHEGVGDEPVNIRIVRKMGATGDISCKYETEAESAQPGYDYEETSGTVEFKAGVSTADVPIVIKAKGRYEGKEVFRLILTEPQGGAVFDAQTDGGEDSCIAWITIAPAPGSKEAVDKMKKGLKINYDRVRVGNANWKKQFTDAISVKGGDDDDEEEPSPAGVADWIFHILSLPWKLLFALIPPTDYAGGWVAFCVALVFIGALTALIGDLAGTFGCLLYSTKPFTAITFVALGTSLPDTFASMAAAQGDPHADASIGNVTGSNSVNVFLGIGIPYAIAAIYWEIQGATTAWQDRDGSLGRRYFQKYMGGDIAAGLPPISTPHGKLYPDGGFIVEAGGLAFSVIIFSICAVLTIATLAVRRVVFKGELGGPFVPKVLTGIWTVLLWFLYIILSWAQEKYGWSI